MGKNMYFSKTIALLLLVRYVSAQEFGVDLIEPPVPAHNISSILCVIKFCQKFFRSDKQVIGSLVVINFQNATEYHSQLVIGLSEYTNYDMGIMIKEATKKHGSTAHVVDRAKNYFLIFNRTSEVVDAISQWQRLPTWNPLAQVVILFINTYDDDILAQMITKVLREFLQRKMLNVNVISYRENTNIVQVHTWYPYEGSNCAKDIFKVHLLEECVYMDEDRFNPTFNIKNLLKQKIPHDLHGCPLRIASSVYEPYVFYDEKNNDFLFGTEVFMIRTICQALNMKPIFMRINGTRANRVISNETGVYSKLLQDTPDGADILIGGFDNDARTQKKVWISIAYFKDDQTWCVATARPRGLWQNIFNIYTFSTWIALIGAVFFIAFIIFLLVNIDKKKETYVWSLLIGMSAALGQYASYEPTRISIRIMLSFCFMYGLVMSSSFSSFLISILTRPRYKAQINSLETAIKEEVSFTGGDVALSHYINNDEVSTYVRKHFTLCEYIDSCLQRLEYDEKLAVALSRLHGYNSPVISRRDIYCFPPEQNIYSYSVVMPIRLDFHLRPQINFIIRQLLEFGLIERWDKLSQSIAENADIMKMINNGGSSDEKHLVVLTVAHIMGAILIMIFGHILASLAFLAETIVYNKLQTEKPSKKWIRLHKILNPKPEDETGKIK